MSLVQETFSFRKIENSFVVSLSLKISLVQQPKQSNKKEKENKVINSILRAATLFKKRLWHRCFPVNFAS